MLKAFGLTVVLCMQSAQGSNPSIIYDEAMRQLNNMKMSNYNHTTYVDEDAGIYEYDCVGKLLVLASFIQPIMNPLMNFNCCFSDLAQFKK